MNHEFEVSIRKQNTYTTKQNKISGFSQRPMQPEWPRKETREKTPLKERRKQSSKLNIIILQRGIGLDGVI